MTFAASLGLRWQRTLTVDQLEMSDQDALDARNSEAGSLIQTDGIFRAVIELGQARRRVSYIPPAPSAVNFPSEVLNQALARRGAGCMPRLALESFWPRETTRISCR